MYKKDMGAAVREMAYAWERYREGDKWYAMRCMYSAYYFWYHAQVSRGCGGDAPYVGMSWEVGPLSDYPRTPAEMFGVRWLRGAEFARMGWYLYDVCCRVRDEVTGAETRRTLAWHYARCRDRASGRRLAREFADRKSVV